MRRRMLLAALPLLLASPAHAQEHHHDMAAMPGMDMAPDAAPAPAPAPAPADTPGNAAPPPVPTDHPADAFFPPERMAAARAALATEGRWTGSALIVDRLVAFLEIASRYRKAAHFDAAEGLAVPRQ